MSEKRTRRVLSIRWIVTGAAVVLTTLAVVAVGGVAEHNARAVLGTELERRVILEARNLAMTSSRALLSDFPELTLAPILKEMGEGRDELALAVVVDREDLIRGHADARRIGEVFQAPLDALPRESGSSEMRRGEFMLENAKLFVASSPVLHPNGNTIGRAWVAFDRGHVTSVIAKTRRRQAIVMLVVLGVGVVIVSVIMGAMLRPVGALRQGLERIGQGDLDTPVRLQDQTEFGLLAETMNEMATAIRDAQSEKVEKERLTREVELAREIQSSLLPHASVHAGGFVVEGAHRAAAEVGGDLWDVFPLHGDRLGIVIADVSGKGLGGCLVTSMVSALMRAFRNEESSPSHLLVRLEQSLPIRPGTFITMFYGILDPSDGSLVFASAGHSPLLIHRQDGACEWYRTKGIPIGAVRGGALERTLIDEKIVLRRGDVLVQYTDGINEAFGGIDDEQFGFQRIETSTKLASPHGARAVVERIREDVKSWIGDRPPHDDETLLVVCQASVPESPTTPGRSHDGESGAAKRPGSDRGATIAPRELDPVAVVKEARRCSHGIAFEADLEELQRLRHWLANIPGLKLERHEWNILESALYELCANVAEHGYGGERTNTFELWWLPAENARELASLERSAGQEIFVLVDDGLSYEPNVDPADFHEPAVRRRGRGLGLTIVRRAMAHVSYHPKTQEGNVTILTFDPARASAEEVSHG